MFFFNDNENALLEAFELPQMKELAESEEFYHRMTLE